MPARRSITVLWLTLALPLAAQGAAGDAEEGKASPRKIPAISVLPDGSELDGVVLPRYDEKLRLTGSLHAGKLTLVSPEIVRGDRVRITLIDPARADGDTRIALGTAVLDQTTGILRADEDVTLESARFTATGSALHFAFEAGRGFVHGPATTVIHATSKTAMHTPATPRHPMLASAALGVAVATSAIAHARPPAVSDADLAELRRASASRAAEAAALTAESRRSLASARDVSTKLSGAARTFLINQVLEPGEEPPAALDRGETKPLQIEATPGDTRILSDGGFYFDADEGILVYLENVRVTDPRFTLEGVDELKVIFAKKPEADGDETKQASGNPDDPAGEFGGGIGEVERVIATGRVLFKQRQPQDGKPPIEASGALFNYTVASGEIILSGGYPWVRQGNYYARALQPDLNLRIRRDGSFATEGSWDTGQNIRR